MRSRPTPQHLSLLFRLHFGHFACTRQPTMKGRSETGRKREREGGRRATHQSWLDSSRGLMQTYAKFCPVAIQLPEGSPFFSFTHSAATFIHSSPPISLHTHSYFYLLHPPSLSSLSAQCEYLTPSLFSGCTSKGTDRPHQCRLVPSLMSFCPCP